MATNDRIRTSDADRERVTARLREHFAEGRLSREELDDRVTAALNAKTFGDLGRVLADLPEPVPVLPQGRRPWGPGPGPAPVFRRRRGPRVFPLVALLLILAVLASGGGWVLATFLQVLLVMALVTILGGVFAAARFRRRVHEHWQAQQEFWGGPGWGGPGGRGPGGRGPGRRGPGRRGPGRRGPGQVGPGQAGPGWSVAEEDSDDEPGGSWGWPGGHWQHHVRYWAGPATPPSRAG
jgi:hypothetical protein